MKKSAAILLIMLFISAVATGQENSAEKEKADFTKVTEVRRQIDGHLAFLKEKNIELKGVPAQLERLEGILKDIEKTEDAEQKLKLLKLAEISSINILRETKALVAYTKRLELLYVMMASFGALVILSILIYSVVQYMRRSRGEEILEGEGDEV